MQDFQAGLMLVVKPKVTNTPNEKSNVQWETLETEKK